jgi:hypothetical protein
MNIDLYIYLYTNNNGTTAPCLLLLDFFMFEHFAIREFDVVDPRLISVAGPDIQLIGIVT